MKFAISLYALGVVVFLMKYRDHVLGGWFQLLVTALGWPLLAIFIPLAFYGWDADANVDAEPQPNTSGQGVDPEARKRIAATTERLRKIEPPKGYCHAIEVPPYIVSAERIMELWNECIDEAGSNIIRFADVLIQEDRKGRK